MSAPLNARRHPSDIQDSRLLAVLDRYVPPIIARSIVERARREAASGPEVSWTDPNGLLDRISVGVRLFAAPEHQSAILREITDLAVADAEPLPSSRPLSEDTGPASTLKPSCAPATAEPASAERHASRHPARATTRRTPRPPPRSATPPLPRSAASASAPSREAPPSRDPRRPLARRSRAALPPPPVARPP